MEAMVLDGQQLGVGSCSSKFLAGRPFIFPSEHSAFCDLLIRIEEAQFSNHNVVFCGRQ